MKKFILYDGRAKVMDTDKASIMDVVSSEEEARREGSTTWEGHDAIWCEYDLKGDEIINEVKRFDLPPCLNKLTLIEQENIIMDMQKKTLKFNHQKLNDLRILSGKTMEEIGQEIGVDKSSVSNWESGERPGPRNLRKLARLFKVSIGTFFMVLFLSLPAYSDPSAESEKLLQLTPQFRAQVKEMLELARISWPDKKIIISEAYRPQKRQDALYKKGRHVTAVKKSKHTLGLAVDIYFLDQNGNIIDYGKAPYDELGVIAESCGMTWGGRWKIPFDPGHFEAK